MAGSFQPTRSHIDAFLNLVPGIPESEVILRLKGNNNNVEQAIGEYFDDSGSGNKYQWSEEQFNSDREGISNNAGIPSFDIQGPDEPGPFGNFSGAPSRPPSRTSNNKSPLSKVIDLTAEHAAADPRDSMTQQEQHDRELEQALSLSRQEAYGLPPQESGITGTDQPHFGPATRSQYEYEQGQWGMVPIKTSAQEILLDPEPAERKRDLDVPAFLKPSIANHRLGAFITIYHEIPLTRNLFLKPLDVLPSYGYDPEWWTGKEIELPSLTGDDSPVEQAVDRELQRLMAFLDKTDRSYGSVDALANMNDVKKALRHQQAGVEAAVLLAWKNLFDNENHNIVKKIFSKGVQSEDQEDSPQGTDFAILELQLPSEDSDLETIYDIADEVLWPELNPRDLDGAPYLSHVADVIAFRFDGNDDGYKKIDVPAVWYPDRYLKESRQAALEMRLKKFEVRENLEQISRLEDYLTSYHVRGPGGGKVVKIQDLFKASLKHDEAEIQEDHTLDDPELDMLPRRQSKAAAVLSTELQKIVAKIDKKLIALNESKEKAREELRKLSKLYTEPSNDPSKPKLHRYSLRGVSTNKSTMYICRRAEPDLIDMDVDGDGQKAKNDQWWRIHYAPIGSSPVTVEKTTEKKVIEAAKNEIRSSILVYASEYAMDMAPVVLPKALETFVRFDNRIFKAELAAPEESQEATGWDAQEIGDSQLDASQPVGLSSPGKRKYHGSDDESNQYQRVNVTEKELRSDEQSNLDDNGAGIMEDVVPTNGEEEHELIVGVDPSLIMKDNEEAGQEMKERGGMPMLSGRKMDAAQMSTIDSMDLDQVIEDEHVAEESSAVKRVGFAE